MAKKQKKQEALSVSRLINEVLVAQLSIPFRQIVNDTTFSKYTGSKRPDILISEFEYDGTNDEQYIKNLVAYAEAKDDCKVGDKDWKDALKQGKIKAPKLGLPYFIVTNCKTTYFYNAKTLKQLTLNGNPIREFQTIDIYRLIKNKLTANPDLNSINTDVIHPSNPLHLIIRFEFFGHTLTLGHLLYQPKKHFLCLPVDVSKVAVQFAAGEQGRIGCPAMLLQVTRVAPSPHADGLLFFLGQFQIRKKIIPNLRVSTAHFFKNRLCHCLFLPFKICISAPCALGLLSLLLHIFCLCNQIIDLLTAKDFPQKTEILQL